VIPFALNRPNFDALVLPSSGHVGIAAFFDDSTDCLDRGGILLDQL
jgi:hypothetical protein